MRRVTLGLAALLVAGCGQPSTQYTGAPAGYLLTLDQLPVPDFSVAEAPHAVGADWLSSAAAPTVQAAGLTAASQVIFNRAVGDLALSNGPIDVRATVAAFADEASADRALTAEIAGLDGLAGAAPVSAGALGDRAHAITRQRTFENVEVVEVTVVWRLGNLVNSMVIHGRYGGARLDDALELAHRQTANEMNGGAPTPIPSATPAPPTASARASASASATP